MDMVALVIGYVVLVCSGLAATIVIVVVCLDRVLRHARLLLAFSLWASRGPGRKYIFGRVKPPEESTSVNWKDWDETPQTEAPK